MDHETTTRSPNYQSTNHQFGRLPKGERRVRFADSMGMELVSIFLFDLISNCYFASFHSHKALQAPPAATALQAATRSLQKQPLAPSTKHTSCATLNRNFNNNNNTRNNHSNNCSNQSYGPLSSSSPSTSPAFDSSSLSSPSCNDQKHYYNKGYHSSTTPNNHGTTTASSFSLSSSSLNKQSQSSYTKSCNAPSATPSSPPKFICEFTQPITLISFKERVKLGKVHLETCNINPSPGYLSVSCTIRVLNIAFEKSVLVRFTTDDWHTHTDSLASYKPGCCDGWSDKFTSTFRVGTQSWQPGQRIIFAIKYTAGSDTYWDNNGGLNYALRPSA